MNKRLQRALYPITEFTGFSEVDGSVLFYNLINSRLKEGAIVLDFGAGRGLAAEDKCEWRRKLTATVLVEVVRIAVDVDPIVKQNPFSAERHVMPIENGYVRIPRDDASVDLVICDWVVEHLPAPAEVFAEFNRVLRPGGTVAIRTSNQWHYAYLAARLLGESQFAAKVLKRAQPNRKEEDVFPKLYLANSQASLREAMGEAGFSKIAVFTWDSEPAYVGNYVLSVLLGFLLHRFAMLGVLPRGTLFGFAEKT